MEWKGSSRLEFTYTYKLAYTYLMSQVTIYLDPDLAERAKEAAASQGLSQSKWIARLIEERLRTSWPESVKRLAGAWPETFPDAETLRQTQGEDLPREPF